MGGNDKKNKKPLDCRILTVEESLNRLKTSRDGLDTAEAGKRLEEYGKNELPGRKTVNIWKIILSQLKSPLIYILIVAGAVSAAIGEIKDSIFVFIIIALNTGLGTYQEWRAEKSAEMLQDYLHVYARVIRDGREKVLDAAAIVPGDIIMLRSGDKVPADIRLIQAKNLSIDESLLTGESAPVGKSIRKEDELKPLSDCENMVFAGTRVTTGRAMGIAVKTGLETEIGKIAEKVQSEYGTKPPLLVRMDKFAKQIGLFVLGGAVILAVIAISEGYGYLEVFLLAVALAVSAIPEGLPVAVTVALSISSNRMAMRNVIIRRLAAVESLGSCTLIASDKTGTLTVNKQTARIIITGSGRRFEVTGQGYDGTGEILDEEGKKIPGKDKEHLERIARAITIDNEAELTGTEDSWEYSGNPVDIAFLALVYKTGLDPAEIRKTAEILGEIPFESENKFSARIYREKNSYRIASKGAPEVIIPMCRKIIEGGRREDIDAGELERSAGMLAAEGYRVIAFAEGRIKKMENYDNLKKDDLAGMDFLGIAGFIDPLRPDVADAIDKSRKAGVKVIMVTGDNPETALTIARELDIASGKEEVITGAELEKYSTGNEENENKDEEFENKIRLKKVFARIAPLQKLRIVEAFQKFGNFVAVTGDGVNDTPALKKADIGVAMGSGTDVTKDTASIIITDDSFSSIVSGIEEGRFAYDNIRKVTYLLISTGVTEVILFIVALLAGLPIALVAVQLLWLNLVTNGIQDVALAFEKGEPGAMERPPRKPSEGIFNRLMFQQVAVSGLFMGVLTIGAWYYLSNSGRELSEARNLLLLLMVLLQNFHLFNCRSERTSAFRIPVSRNYLLVGGVILAQGLHIGSMYIPVMQNLLGVSPVSIGEWGLLAALAFSIIIVMEIFKFIKRKTEAAAGRSRD
ncbi:MAG: HAD-IC family P-type ATPase [Actinobacteria bacterium]|nr:HAD-IC family P-type ATPase [Actinomycetota bacterium]